MANDPGPAQLQQAIQLHQQGRLAEAAQRYQEILGSDPNCADAQYLIGVIASQTNQPQVAVGWIEKALASSPNNLSYLRSLGFAYAQLLRFDDATRVYQAILRIDPNVAEVWNSLGNTYSRVENFQQASAAFERALAIRPDYFEALYNYGLLLSRHERRGEAKQCLAKAIQLQPQFSSAHQLLGHILREEMLWPQAIQAYRQAVSYQPNAPEHRMDLANALQETGAVAEAINEYMKAIEQAPMDGVLYRNLGNAYRKNRAFDLAIRAYDRSLELTPESITTRMHLASTYQLQGDAAKARQAYVEVLARSPNDAEVYYNLGQVLQELGDNEAALAAYEDCLRIDDDYACAWSAMVFLKQQLCLWADLEEQSLRVIRNVEESHSCRLKDLTTPLSFLAISVPSTPAQQLRCAQRWVEAICQLHHSNSSLLTKSPVRISHRSHARTNSSGKLRLGYFSGDLQDHAVAFQIVEFIEQHDRSLFEVFAYSFGKDDGGAMRQRIIQAVDHFRDIENKTHSETAQIIAEDDIDILIDLQGHTKNARFEVLAGRPAKIQLSYLGFAGTTGASFIDAVIGDDFATPPALQPFFAEKLIRLPGCFMANDSQLRFAEQETTRHEYRLPENAFVFAAFHSSYKISPKMFDLWLRILHRVPNSVLWLGPMQEIARRNLVVRAKASGISATRIIFSPFVPRADALNRVKNADLFLDAFPYNAHSTACETLRVGVPLLTMSGESFVSRVAGSVLHSLGLDDLIVNDDTSYFQLAADLALNPDVLMDVRQRLKKALSTTDVFDGRAFARKLEAAFMQLATEKIGFSVTNG